MANWQWSGPSCVRAILSSWRQAKLLAEKQGLNTLAQEAVKRCRMVEAAMAADANEKTATKED